MCITGPASVPGLSGPPKWVGAPASYPDLQTGARFDLDDPRWAGAPLTPFAANIAGAAPTYRILRAENSLYVSLHAPLGSSGTDVVYFGFSQDAQPTSKAYLLPIYPAAAGSGVDPILRDPTHYYVYNGVSWVYTPTKPPFLHETATWRDSSQTGVAFGVNFRIGLKPTPFTPGKDRVYVNPFTPFHVFAGMGVMVEPVGAIEYSAPTVPESITSFVASGIHVPANHADWATYDGPGVTCSEGVTLDTHNVRTGHPDGCSLYTSDTSQNSFVVEPQQVLSTLPFIDNIVRVELAVSDWGAMANDSTAPWTVIPGTEDGKMTSGSWTWAWNPSTGIPVGGYGSATIGFTCDIQLGKTFCPSVTIPTGASPPGVSNQALLATLLPDRNHPNSKDLRFLRPSAILNVIYAGLSEFEQDATISLRGTPKPKDPKQTHRDVYLKVVRRNMPVYGNDRLNLPLDRMHGLMRFVRNPPHSPFQAPYEPVPQPGGKLSSAPGAASRAADARAAARAAAPPAQAPKAPAPGVPVTPVKPQPQPQPAPQPAPKAHDLEPARELPYPLPLAYSSATHHELMSRAWPVYEVHAFYDRGEALAANGKPQKRLQALAPFGYLLHHEGPFYGFTDAIAGIDGAKLTQVAPDLYRVSVPHDGKVRIKTTIRAEERPKADCCNQKPPVVNVHVSPRGCYCRAPGGAAVAPQLLPLSLLPIALFFWRRKRRARG
jgi:hypothetical protein